MEKISCDVILDLLPLYCDEVCSPDSRALVQEHLKNCPGCSKILDQLKTECHLPDALEQNHEAIVKDLAATWQNTVKKTFLRGVLITLCACGLLFGTYLTLTRLLLVMVPAGRVEIAVENVTDQSVELSIQVTDHKKVSRLSTHTTDDGKCYIIMKRGALATENGAGENWECTQTISRTGTLKSGDKVPITEIYYGREGEGILIWQAANGS